MASTDAMAFWTVFLILFFIGISLPPIMIGLGESYTEQNTDNLEVDEAPGFTSFIAPSLINILAVPFWTFGIPSWMNLVMLTPLRVLAWYLFLRMIRGN